VLFVEYLVPPPEHIAAPIAVVWGRPWIRALSGAPAVAAEPMLGVLALHCQRVAVIIRQEHVQVSALKARLILSWAGGPGPPIEDLAVAGMLPDTVNDIDSSANVDNTGAKHEKVYTDFWPLYHLASRDKVVVV
jgi:hypothetical protein